LTPSSRCGKSLRCAVLHSIKWDGLAFNQLRRSCIQSSGTVLHSVVICVGFSMLSTIINRGSVDSIARQILDCSASPIPRSDPARARCHLKHSSMKIFCWKQVIS
jgi:hypothetical protein